MQKAERMRRQAVEKAMKKITKLTDEKLEQIHKEGKTCAQYQVEQTLAMIEKVKV